MNILDKGYCELVEAWGSEDSIIRAARMSTNKGFINRENDIRLLTYLYTHRHFSPFEMAGATFEMKMPIFVCRELVRHRTFSFNEMSARYTEIPDENYVPNFDDILERAKKVSNNKQEKGIKEIDTTKLKEWLSDLDALYYSIQRLYEAGLEAGVPRELARIILPVGRYTKIRMSGNLRNWLHFLELRMADNAQKEIRVYANYIHQELSEIFPIVMGLFDNRVID